jgi:hypothetical protein
MMRIVKRIAIVLLELLVEALLLGSVFGALLSSKPSDLPYGILASILTVPAILTIHGYYISRLLATIALASRAKWLYPAVAALAFFAHVLFMISELEPGEVTPRAQAMTVPFLMGGTCIVFCCAFGGKKAFQMWTRAHPPIHDSIPPL